MEGDLECTKCSSIVNVESNWYGLSVRFKFKCKCNELDILSNASYTETFDEALRRRKEWKHYTQTKEKCCEKHRVKSKVQDFCGNCGTTLL
ncbi:MAG: hypothetical protein GX236_11230 [Clostridiaceae bacterium]|nr:hypothetical protein [Clostridiaceae bacterium]